MARPRSSGAVKLRKKKLSSGQESLYLDIYKDGTRSYEFLQLYLVGDRATDRKTLLLAERTCAQRELELRADALNPRSESARKQSFFEWIAGSGVTKDTCYFSTIGHLRLVSPNLTFADIDLGLIKRFRAHLEKAGLAPNTVVRYYAVLRHACRLAWKQGLLQSNPCDKDDPPRIKETEITALTIEELRILAATECPSPLAKRAFLFACFTGLRGIDIEKARVSDISERRIAIRQSKTQRWVYIPLSDEALDIIGDLAAAASDRPLFPGFRKSTLMYGPTGSIARWARAAGIRKRITFHVSRHTFATLALTYGADIYTVSKLLGHGSIAMTERYARVVDQKKRSAVDSIPRLEIK